MKKLNLGFDLDAIIIQLVPDWVAWYNEKFDHDIHEDHITDYRVEKFMTKATVDEIFHYFADQGERYKTCPVIPGATEGLKALHDAGHDITVTTASVIGTADAKWDLVKKAAPWLKHGDVMVGSKKQRLQFDVFCDDAPKNIVHYKNEWPKAHLVSISYPYNQEIQSLVNLFAQDYRNTENAWKQIVEYINDVAERW